MRIFSAIYPFYSQILPIVDNFDEMQSIYSLKAIISPPGLGLIGHNAGYACNKKNDNFIVAGLEELNSSYWDTLHLFRPPIEMSLDSSFICRTMETAISKGKHIIYYDYEKGEISKEILDLQKRNRNEFFIRVENTDPYNNYHEWGNFFKLTAPVILVGGLVQCPEMLDVLLSLSKHFIKSEINPIVVTNQPIGQLFGFHNIHHLFSSQQVTESLKIREINRYFAAIEKKDFPGVFIVEAPDAVMRYGDIDPNGYGILTYMLAQAIKPDIFICCVPVELAESNFIENLSRDFQIRLGTPIHIVQVSNIVIDTADLIQRKQLSYIFVNGKRVKNQIEKKSLNSHIPFIDIDWDGEDKLFQYIDSSMKTIY
jgi:peptide maturation system protein (TIGR04066 family)